MKFYDYIFYIFYRFWEKAPSRWWSDWKAAITMVFLSIAIVATINNLLMYLLKTTLLSDYPIFALVLSGFISMIHYFMYLQNDIWKEKILKFRSINKKKDIYGIIIVILMTGLILFGLQYSIYL